MKLTPHDQKLLEALRKIDPIIEENKRNLTLTSKVAKPYGYGFKGIKYEKTYFNDAEHFKNYVKKALKNNFNYTSPDLDSRLIKFFVFKCTNENNFVGKAIQLIKEIRDEDSLNKFLEFIE